MLTNSEAELINKYIEDHNYDVWIPFNDINYNVRGISEHYEFRHSFFVVLDPDPEEQNQQTLEYIRFADTLPFDLNKLSLINQLRRLINVPLYEIVPDEQGKTYIRLQNKKQ